MKKIKILILGSREEKIDKKFEFEKIYAANAAIKLVENLKTSTTQTTSVCASIALMRDQDINEIVMNSNPDRLFARGELKKPKELNDKIFFKSFSDLNQFLFQKDFFKFGILHILIAEFFLYGSFKEKIKNIIKVIKDRRIMGVSTGFFSIMLALKENPNEDILISGIGMRDGSHFHKTLEGRNFNKRPTVDRYLVNFLKNKYKKKLYSFDKELVKITGINLLT
tara:strand:+ start:3462 stop:4133 length:672 start_codon:yes stop_codon:yes gene_type:complete